MRLLWEHKDEMGRELGLWRREDGALVPISVQQEHLGLDSHVHLAAAELLHLAEGLLMPTALRVELETLAVVEGVLGVTLRTLSGPEREP